MRRIAWLGPLAIEAVLAVADRILQSRERQTDFAVVGTSRQLERKKLRSVARDRPIFEPQRERIEFITGEAKCLAGESLRGDKAISLFVSQAQVGHPRLVRAPRRDPFRLLRRQSKAEES